MNVLSHESESAIEVLMWHLAALPVNAAVQITSLTMPTYSPCRRCGIVMFFVCPFAESNAEKGLQEGHSWRLMHSDCFCMMHTESARDRYECTTERQPHSFRLTTHTHCCWPCRSPQFSAHAVCVIRCGIVDIRRTRFLSH